MGRVDRETAIRFTTDVLSSMWFATQQGLQASQNAGELYHPAVQSQAAAAWRNLDAWQRITHIAASTPDKLQYTEADVPRPTSSSTPDPLHPNASLELKYSTARAILHSGQSGLLPRGKPEESGAPQVYFELLDLFTDSATELMTAVEEARVNFSDPKHQRSLDERTADQLDTTQNLIAIAFNTIVTQVTTVGLVAAYNPQSQKIERRNLAGAQWILSASGQVSIFFLNRILSPNDSEFSSESSATTQDHSLLNSRLRELHDQIKKHTTLLKW